VAATKNFVLVLGKTNAPVTAQCLVSGRLTSQDHRDRAEDPATVKRAEIHLPAPSVGFGILVSLWPFSYLGAAGYGSAPRPQPAPRPAC